MLRELRQLDGGSVPGEVWPRSALDPLDATAAWVRGTPPGPDDKKPRPVEAVEVAEALHDLTGIPLSTIRSREPAAPRWWPGRPEEGTEAPE